MSRRQVAMASRRSSWLATTTSRSCSLASRTTRFSGAGERALLDRMGRIDHLADLGAALRLHDHLIAAGELQGAWIEVVDFAARLEDDTHDIGH